MNVYVFTRKMGFPTTLLRKRTGGFPNIGGFPTTLLRKRTGGFPNIGIWALKIR